MIFFSLCVYIAAFALAVFALEPRYETVRYPRGTGTYTRIAERPIWERMNVGESDAGCTKKFEGWIEKELNQSKESIRYLDDPCVESWVARTMSKQEFEDLGLGVATVASEVREGTAILSGY